MHARPVASIAELEKILALQRKNLARNVDPVEAASQGFVTVEHTLDILARMHALAPSLVAFDDDDTLAGYALVMPVECRTLLPILAPMFSRLENRGEKDYYIMGQICVAKEHRGKGVFDALYAAHRAHLEDRFAACITEVATRNGRSMRAHARVGFEEIERYRDATDEWSLLRWRWRG